MQLVIHQLSKSYGAERQALDRVDLTIGHGIFGLLGPNGAGKSTLMQILATLIPSTSGEVKLGDAVLGRDDQRIRHMLGYLPQEFGVYKKLTAEEYLDYVALMKGMHNRAQRKLQIADLLEQVNLSSHRRRKIGSFSGGMRQRVGIAQALLGDPQLIIVDEPTAGLDPEERLRFRHVLDDLAADRIVLLSTHIVSDIESTCSRLAILRRGRVVFDGAREQLAAKAEGCVWSAVVRETDVAVLRGKPGVQVLSSRRLSDGMEVRLLAQEAPIAGAIAVDASLEDGYMLSMGEVAHA